MFRKRSSTVLLGLLLCAASAAAQVNVTLQLPFAQMPSRVAEWRENESLIRIVVQNTGREQYEGLMLSVELSKDGRRIARSRDGHPAQPRFSLSQGETRSLSWREVISEEAVEYDGSIRQQVAATGELPEGQYRLCVQVLNAQLRPISPQACGSFGIVLADPPVLVSPIGGAQASPTPLLQWRPSNPPAPGLQYQVTVKVRYRGQTPAQAMASNPVRLQATVPTTSYQVPVTEQLGGDAADPNYAGHVWQVQALLNGRPYGRNRGLSQIEWFVVPPIAVDTVKPSGGRPIAVVEWEVPYEEIRPGRPIKLQVPPIQEDTVLYVLRVRVPERLTLQQLEQLRKNWAHEVRKEISAERTHQDTFVVQTIYGRRDPVILGMGQDTAGAGVDRTRYTGGFFLYRVGQDTFVVPKVCVGRSSLYGFSTPQDTAGAVVFGYVYNGYFLFRIEQDTFGIQSKFTGVYMGPQDTAGIQFIGKRVVGYYLYRLEQDTFKTVYGRYAGRFYLYGTPQDTAGAGVDRTRYTGGFFLYGMGQDTFGVQYFPGKEVVGYYLDGTPQDTAGAGVDRTRYTGGFFLYGMGQDTFGVFEEKYWWPPKEIVVYHVGQDTFRVQYLKPRYTGGFYLFGMGQDTVPPITSPPTTAALVPPTYTVWIKQPIGYPVEGGIVLGEFTPTYVGLPGPFPESISANIRRGTQGEIVVTFTQLH
jgi:hypothetical protein